MGRGGHQGLPAHDTGHSGNTPAGGIGGGVGGIRGAGRVGWGWGWWQPSPQAPPTSNYQRLETHIPIFACQSTHPVAAPSGPGAREGPPQDADSQGRTSHCLRGEDPPPLTPCMHSRPNPWLLHSVLPYGHVPLPCHYLPCPALPCPLLSSHAPPCPVPACPPLPAPPCCVLPAASSTIVSPSSPFPSRSTTPQSAPLPACRCCAMRACWWRVPPSCLRGTIRPSSAAAMTLGGCLMIMAMTMSSAISCPLVSHPTDPPPRACPPPLPPPIYTHAPPHPPRYIKKLKMEILTLMASSANAYDIVGESGLRDAAAPVIPLLTIDCSAFVSAPVLRPALQTSQPLFSRPQHGPPGRTLPRPLQRTTTHCSPHAAVTCMQTLPTRIPQLTRLPACLLQAS